MRKLLLLLAVAVASIATPAAMAGPAEADGPGVPLAESNFAGAITAGPDGNVWFSAGNYSGGELGARLVGKGTPAGGPPGGPACNVWFSAGNYSGGELGAGLAGKFPRGGEVPAFVPPPGAA